MHSQLVKELNLYINFDEVLCTTYEVHDLVAEELIWVESKRFLATKLNTHFYALPKFQENITLTF